MLQFQPGKPDRRWHATSLGIAGIGEPPDLIAEQLLLEAIRHAGDRGVKRLYARVPSGAPLLTAFPKAGFAPYATETIFSADAVRMSRMFGVVRRQEPADTWAIHQLYNASTPRQVQYAEAFTSHRWELSEGWRERSNVQESGWLLDDGPLLAGYVRTAESRQALVIDMLYHPERTQLVPELLSGTLRQLGIQTRERPIFVVLRGYQAEAAKIVESLGFHPAVEQDLLVKYTTAPVRAPLTEPVIFHPEIIERLPKRVPSFLSALPPDKPA